MSASYLAYIQEEIMEKYVFFDIDGTLNRTDLYAVEAYQKALLKRGIHTNREKIISCFGLKPNTIAEIFLGKPGEEELISWKRDIEEYEFYFMEKNARPFDGITEMLSALKCAGFGLAICSNAFPKHINHVLSVLGLAQYFREIGSLDMGTNKGEIIKKIMVRTSSRKACMVGDRKFDLQAAEANHIPIIGCAYGYAPDEIKNASIVVNSPGEIVKAVNELL